MKKLLDNLGWIDSKGKVDKTEIYIDLLVLIVAGVFIYIIKAYVEGG